MVRRIWISALPLPSSSVEDSSTGSAGYAQAGDVRWWERTKGAVDSSSYNSFGFFVFSNYGRHDLVRRCRSSLGL